MDIIIPNLLFALWIVGALLMLRSYLQPGFDRETILDNLSETEERSAEEIRRRCDGLTLERVQLTLDQLVQDGIVLFSTSTGQPTRFYYRKPAPPQGNFPEMAFAASAFA